MKGIGIDIVPIPRITRLIERYDLETLSLLFVSKEIERCQASSNPNRSFAICFAAKEAVGKALGTGLVDVGCHEIEATPLQDKVIVQLEEAASIQAKRLAIRSWLGHWCSWDDHVLVRMLAV